MAITTREQLAAAMANAFIYQVVKASSITCSQTVRLTSWQHTGTPPAQTAIPLPTPAAGNTWYLAEMQASGRDPTHTFWLYDRYAASSSILADPGGFYSVTGCSLPARVTNQNSGHQIWIEIVGTTSAVSGVTVTYTNSAGQGGRTAILQGSLTAASSTAGLANGPMLLAAGDTGVRSVETITVPSGTGVTGTLNVVLAKPLAAVSVDAITREPTRAGWAELGLVDVGTTPSLYLMATGVNGATASATLTFVQG